MRKGIGSPRPLHPIHLNTANSTELQEVPGIRPVTADKILKMRKSYGPLADWLTLRSFAHLPGCAKDDRFTFFKN
jgi:DNA uptake protein ComE-like DNA-binding protein